MDIRYCDETEFGFGWIAADPPVLQRTSHALVVDGGVWLIDPVDGGDVDERIERLGEPRGVLMLLDRHRRDCAAFAERFSVPLYRTPFDGVREIPFSFIPVVRRRLWREVALWWEEGRVLVCAEAVASAPVFRARGEQLAVHPALRAFPPRRPLGGLEPEHLLLGHGDGFHGPGATTALQAALAGSRRTAPRWAWERLVAAMRSRTDKT